ncbi:L-aspartate oxidase [Abeliophyllum distichum]|uniref:L-aspartate oxidase n=1 Tax=Abeliophyllum distichum TaxID=126358 RepID=A0ABD1NSH4_9LAMI
MSASFDHGEDGNSHLAREGGHSHRKIMHAADMTGKEIEKALLEAVRKDPNIVVFEHHFAIYLLTSQGTTKRLRFKGGFSSNFNFLQLARADLAEEKFRNGLLRFAADFPKFCNGLNVKTEKGKELLV